MDATIIYPHQLFKTNSAIQSGRKVFLVEEPLMISEFPAHAQKLLLHRLSMKAYQQELEQQGFDVQYVEAVDLADTEAVFVFLQKQGIQELHVTDTTDRWLEMRITQYCKRYNMTRVSYESPLFILPRQEAVDRYVGSKKHMARFYKQLRIDKNILMQDDEPVGGRWSFDEDNRKKLPRGHVIEESIASIENDTVDEARTWLENLDAEMYGANTVWLPYTRADAEQWLADFLKHRFEHFGTYEDALSMQYTVLYHSAISPLMNIGLLSPQLVIEQSINYAEQHEVPINSLEGFVRQILGWREFMRASYETDGDNMRSKNFFQHTKTLSVKWWTGNTGIDPVDDSIKNALQYGYNHHIERLMVIGNVMLLSQLHPDQVYKWFMAMYVDAYDWVMVPNVYGMSQFADGGSFATKPYVAGANYIKKMSDYPKGEWEDTMTGLYWNFIHEHQSVFAANHRMSMMPRLLEKMDQDKKERHLFLAQQFIQD